MARRGRVWRTRAEEERSGRRRRTVADYLAIAVLDDIEERRPFHEIVEVEVQVVVLGQGIEVGQVQAEQVAGRHAPDRGHGEVESAGGHEAGQRRSDRGP